MSDSTPLVSVILPTYNRVGVISRAIDSVLSQNYCNFELIIIDDGSSDGTKQHLSQYKEQLTYIYQTNKGVSSARNKAIEYAKGEVLAFIDSDDEWLANKLSKQVAFLLDNSLDMLSCVFNTFDVAGVLKEKRLMSRALKKIKAFEDVFAFPYLGTSTVLIKRASFDNIGGFDENLHTAEDLDLFLKVAAKYNVGFLNDCFVNKYESRHGLGAGLDSYEDNLLVITKVLQQHADYFSSRGQLVNEVMSNLHVAYARSLLWHKKPVQARKSLLSANHYKRTLECYCLTLKSYVI